MLPIIRQFRYTNDGFIQLFLHPMLLQNPQPMLSSAASIGSVHCKDRPTRQQEDGGAVIAAIERR